MDSQSSVSIRVRLLQRGGRLLELPALRADCRYPEPPAGLVERAVLELFRHGCQRELQSTVCSQDSGLLRLSIVLEPLSCREYVLVAFPAVRSCFSNNGRSLITQAVYGIQVGAECPGLTETEVLNRIRDAFGADSCDGVRLSAYERAETPPLPGAVHGPRPSSNAPSPRERECASGVAETVRGWVWCGAFAWKGVVGRERKGPQRGG